MSKKIIIQRKNDHLVHALADDAQIGDAGFEKYRFVHNALPEINFEDIDVSTTFLGKKVNYPFFISCMTGGVEKGQTLNKNLAIAAQKHNIAMGVGSQRIALAHPELKKLFEIRKYAPDIPVLGNIGLSQLNYGLDLARLEECVAMIKADAMVFHLNPIQEVIQFEGDRNFDNLLPKLEKVVKKLSVPVIIKEVGFGLSEDVVGRLYDAGVRIFDTSGWGGTNWAHVEGARGKGTKELAEAFSDWGIPTADSIIAAKKVKEKKKDKKMVILGSGGIRTGIDVAKSIALGADLVGIAAPFAKAALKSSTEVDNLIERLGQELKVAMFGMGVDEVRGLMNIQLSQAS